MDHEPTVWPIEWGELLEFCNSAGYRCRLEPAGSLLIPPDYNVGMTDWEKSLKLRRGEFGVLGEQEVAAAPAPARGLALDDAAIWGWAAEDLPQGEHPRWRGVCTKRLVAWVYWAIAVLGGGDEAHLQACGLAECVHAPSLHAHCLQAPACCLLTAAACRWPHPALQTRRRWRRRSSTPGWMPSCATRLSWTGCAATLSTCCRTTEAAATGCSHTAQVLPSLFARLLRDCAQRNRCLHQPHRSLQYGTSLGGARGAQQLLVLAKASNCRTCSPRPPLCTFDPIERERLGHCYAPAPALRDSPRASPDLSGNHSPEVLSPRMRRRWRLPSPCTGRPHNLRRPRTLAVPLLFRPHPPPPNPLSSVFEQMPFFSSAQVHSAAPPGRQAFSARAARLAVSPIC